MNNELNDIILDLSQIITQNQTGEIFLFNFFSIVKIQAFIILKFE